MSRNTNFVTFEMDDNKFNQNPLPPPTTAQRPKVQGPKLTRSLLIYSVKKK